MVLSWLSVAACGLWQPTQLILPSGTGWCEGSWNWAKTCWWQSLHEFSGLAVLVDRSGSRGR